MKVFVIVLDSCRFTHDAFSMLDGIIRKNTTTVTSMKHNVCKYKTKINKKTTNIEVVVVESAQPNGNGRKRLDYISKAAKRNISAFPTILKQKGNKYVEMSPTLERTSKNILKFLE
jgi:hypothetical protein